MRACSCSAAWTTSPSAAARSSSRWAALPASQFSINSFGRLRPGLVVVGQRPRRPRFGVRLEREQWPTGGVTVDAQWLGHTRISNAAVPKLKTPRQPAVRVHLGLRSARPSGWCAATPGSSPRWWIPSRARRGALARRGGAVPSRPRHARRVARRTGLDGRSDHGPGADAAQSGLRVAAHRPGGTSTSPGSSAPAPRCRLAGSIGTPTSCRAAPISTSPRRRWPARPGRAARSTARCSSSGAMLAATPGTNRRFGDFDRVWALDPSGYSDYWGVTVSFGAGARAGAQSSGRATPTRARPTTGPAPPGSVPEQQLSPFPDGTRAARLAGRPLRSRRAASRRGRRRAVVGVGTLAGATRRRRVAALVRYRSGAPFTPGFRDGVDANGDGAWGNDPAFVSDTVAGAADVIARGLVPPRQVGQFAAAELLPGARRSSAVDAGSSCALFNALRRPRRGRRGRREPRGDRRRASWIARSTWWIRPGRSRPRPAPVSVHRAARRQPELRQAAGSPLAGRGRARRAAVQLLMRHAPLLRAVAARRPSRPRLHQRRREPDHGHPGHRARWSASCSWTPTAPG